MTAPPTGRLNPPIGDNQTRVSATTDLTFDDVIAWLTAREGTTVLLEIGAFDPERDRYNEPYLMLDGITLGPVLSGKHAHAGRPAAVVTVTNAGEGSRLSLDPSQFQSAKENHGAIKVQLQNTYIALVSVR